jgi:alpha-ketoglutarate-dependent sulfate ester dioxygenase
MTQPNATNSKPFYGNLPDPENPLDVAPVGGSIGAEIKGVALSGDLADSTIAAIRGALIRHKVIFFRNQQLDDQSHEAFATRLGDLIRGSAPPASGSNFLIELNSTDGYAANRWHTDQTYMPTPPNMTMLRAVISPPAGGDTLWANTAAAYANLPAPLKILADNLWGIHNSSFDYGALFGKDKVEQDKDDKWLQTARPFLVESEHPVVRVHPESGERTLLVGSYFQRFVDLNGDDSQHLLGIFQDHITLPENTVRWRWSQGDIAIWDNRATQHRAVADQGTQLRVMRRSTMGYSTPAGIDGRQSKSRKP